MQVRGWDRVCVLWQGADKHTTHGIALQKWRWGYEGFEFRWSVRCNGSFGAFNIFKAVMLELHKTMPFLNTTHFVTDCPSSQYQNSSMCTLVAWPKWQVHQITGEASLCYLVYDVSAELEENCISSESVMTMHVTVSEQHAEAKRNKTNAP